MADNPVKFTSDLDEQVEFKGTPCKRQFISAGLKPNTEVAPKYSLLSLESLPTPWAVFEQESRYLKDPQQYAAEIDEWGALLLLLYLGRATTRPLDVERLKALDPELEKALISTTDSPLFHPESGGPIADRVTLIISNDAPVSLGALHPLWLACPARDRLGWSALGIVEKGRLSLKALLASCDDQQKQAFVRHLQNIRESLPGGRRNDADNVVGGALQACVRAVGAAASANGKTRYGLADDPDAWSSVRISSGFAKVDPRERAQQFLASYPFQWVERESGFIVTPDGLDPSLNPWLKHSLSTELPVPLANVRKIDDSTVSVGGVPVKVAGPGSPGQYRVVAIQELLLHEHWQFVPDAARPVTSAPDYFGGLERKFIPLKSEFFREFPFRRLGKNALSWKTDDSGPERVEVWSVTLPAVPNSITVTWTSKPVATTKLGRVLAECWPPLASDKWKLYFVRFVGIQPAADGTADWLAIDENGNALFDESGPRSDPKLRRIPIGEDAGEYIQLLRSYPRALVLKVNDRQCGLLAFNLATAKSDGATAETLAVDFGTSNTCLSWRSSTETKVLRFDLAPALLWGVPSERDIQGWFPRSWATTPSSEFFPTLLWYRPLQGLGELTGGADFLSWFPQLDLPGLRKDSGTAPPDSWQQSRNLKWGGVLFGNANTTINPGPRDFFLKYIILLAHAQLHFGRSSSVSARPDRYVFTFPLAMQKERDNYESACIKVVQYVARLAFGDEVPASAVKLLSESHAVALSENRGQGQNGMRDVVLDVGGGTADVCILRGRTPACLDSVRLAGSRFFDVVCRTVNEGRKQHEHTLEYLGTMLDWNNVHESDAAQKQIALQRVKDFSREPERLGAAYGIMIRAVPSFDLPKREKAIINDCDSSAQFSTFWVRGMFRQVIGFSLILAAADIVNEALDPKSTPFDQWPAPQIRIKPAGNGWGLLPFGKTSPRESESMTSMCREVWKIIRDGLVEELPLPDTNNNTAALSGLLERIQVDIEPIREATAKTSVAIGAARANSDDLNRRSATRLTSYFGVSLDGMVISGEEPKTPIAWYSPLQFGSIKVSLGNHCDKITFPPARVQVNRPLHPLQGALLSLFVRSRDLRPNVDFVRWNNRLVNAYDEGKLLETEKATEEDDSSKSVLKRSAISFLLEQFHIDEQFENELSLNQRLIDP